MPLETMLPLLLSTLEVLLLPVGPFRRSVVEDTLLEA